MNLSQETSALGRPVYRDCADGVLTLTLADEANRNALGGELVAELLDALDEAERRDDVRVVVLTNVGKIFCAGANLKQRSVGAEAPRRVRGVDLFRRLHEFPKPTVGRIAGHCVAGGMGVAAALDIAIAAEDAMFGFTEVRVGVAPAIISVICLPKMRAADARSAFLRGNRFPAAEAARMGLITSAVPRPRLDEEVRGVVGDLLAGGPQALRTTKTLFRRIPVMDTEAAFAWASQLSDALFASDEGREGMSAFLERRPPAWAVRDRST
jgi:methylglutaconyl-CoA hydratase